MNCLIHLSGWDSSFYCGGIFRPKKYLPKKFYALLNLHGSRNAQAFSALCSATSDQLASILWTHTFTKTMLVNSLPSGGLVCSFHFFSFFSWKSGTKVSWILQFDKFSHLFDAFFYRLPPISAWDSPISVTFQTVMMSFSLASIISSIFLTWLSVIFWISSSLLLPMSSG